MFSFVYHSIIRRVSGPIVALVPLSNYITIK